MPGIHCCNLCKPITEPLCSLYRNYIRPLLNKLTKSVHSIACKIIPCMKPKIEHLKDKKVVVVDYRKLENLCGTIAADALKSGTKKVVQIFKDEVDSEQIAKVRSIFDDLLEELKKFENTSYTEDYCNYNYGTLSDDLKNIKYGNRVREYYANVAGSQSMIDRKYQSLLGIRNLLLVGPQIIDDFKEYDFIGGDDNYSSGKGVKAYKYYTGNTVDLETPLENAYNDETAIEEAEKAIITFGKKRGLNPNSAKDVEKALPHRKLDLPKNGNVHYAVGHKERCMTGVWKRQFGGQMHYFANVPEIETVVLATLRLPYILAEAAEKGRDKDGNWKDGFLEGFFKNAISDKCFNDKLRAALEFAMQQEPATTTPEEKVINEVDEGRFGDELKEIGGKKAVEEVITFNSLTTTLDKAYQEKTGKDLESEGLSKDEWLQKHTQTIKDIYKDRLNKALYKKNEDSNYFLFNESELEKIIGECYDFLVASGM